MASRNRCSVSAIILLSNGPGATAFTVMRGASRRARTRVRWCTAALLAEYAYVSSTGTCSPSIDPMLMMRAGSPGRAACSRSGSRKRER